MKCRHCYNTLDQVFVDLVNSPPSNAFLTEDQLDKPEVFYPLKLFVCDECFLVQIAEYKKSDEIFNQEYVYFSSFSESWLDHAKSYADMITKRLRLSDRSLVAEIASNDGYLLQYFNAKQIPCFGIEPATQTADVARGKGIEVIG
ncbi:SAM-dependent methyltransferase, partial [Thermodesulfobacteriota bacterium]